MMSQAVRITRLELFLAAFILGSAVKPAKAQHVHTATVPSGIGSKAQLPATMHADMREMEIAMSEHLEMTPHRLMTPADSIRASGIVTELRSAIAKYRDVNIAEADGFKMFAPQVQNQRIYHLTKNLWALENQFRFNPEKPTSLLYRKDAQGNFILVGAMYTAPKRYSALDLDKRIPTSVAQWHKHVNWCLPPRREEDRWTEIRNGRSVFGPLGVATREECDAAGGRFVKEIFGWMVHANVFASEDPNMIWSGDHMRGDEMMDHGHENLKQ
jgi:hypothetical protein